MDADRSQYDELDDAIAQRREQSLLENEIESLQKQVNEMQILLAGDISLLQQHVYRLELSQNNCLTMVDYLQARMDASEEQDREPPAKIGFWTRIKLKLVNLWRKLCHH